jgi:sugar phosphate isomerase/epimerase
MTFHMGGRSWGYIRGEAEIEQHHLESAQHAPELARPHRLPVGYEAGGLRDLKLVCDRVPGWGINLDIGHAHMAAGTDEGYLRYLDEFQGRIVEVHHNGVNYCWGRYMEHQPPHLNNMLDFPATYQRLRDDGYQGPIVCEIQGQDIAQVIRHRQESKDMIVGLWRGTLTMADRWYEGR